MSDRKVGRYDRVQDAQAPGPDLPRAKLVGRVETVTAAVADPTILGREKLKRQKVSVNRLTDPLECEYSFGRISKAAYDAGNAYMAVCEIRSGGSSFEPSAGGGSHELAIGYAMERAARIVEMQEGVLRALGQSGALLLRHVLADGGRLDAMAETGVRASRRRVRHGFREALEGLARHFDRDGWPGA